jgi:hypothetical protein
MTLFKDFEASLQAATNSRKGLDAVACSKLADSNLVLLQQEMHRCCFTRHEATRTSKIEVFLSQFTPHLQR